MSDALTSLDGHLFQADSWRALSRTNTQVKGVYPATLAQGLALVGRAGVATIYGRLRDAVRVVDIDVAGIDGYSLTDQVEAWAAGRDVWHLSRPSGGADGRHHVYLLTRDAGGDHLPALRSELARLRTDYRLPSPALDVRDAVRPLSAPHRTGVTTAPYGDVVWALDDLRRRLARTPRPDPAQDAHPHHSPTPGGQAHEDSRTPLVPRPRPRRALPPDWASYLVTGIRPPVGGTDRSWTTVEAVCLGHMIRAGYTWRDALHAIWDAHEHAMTRARTGGLHRLIGIWNRAVAEDAAWTAEHGITRADAPPLPEAIAAALTTARAALDALAWTLPPRQRPAVLHVGDAILARAARTHTLRVPCPERDLAQDTGLHRATVRHALTVLDGHLGRLCIEDFTRAPSQRRTSSFEFEIPAVEQGVGLICPPCSHTPWEERPPVPLGTWEVLPRRAHQIHRSLPREAGLPLDEVAHQAHVTDSPTSPLTRDQARSLTHDLRALAHAGLAVCDEHGCWRRLDSPTPEHTRHATTAHSTTLTRHQAERATYRAGTGTDWLTARRDVLARNYAREQAWWRALTPAERARRRDAGRARYRALPLTEQAHVKDELAARRHRAGLDEAQRHAAWLAAWHPDGLAQRQAEHQHAYQALPAPLRGAYRAMWHDHRTRWNIPHPASVTKESACTPTSSP